MMDIPDDLGAPDGYSFRPHPTGSSSSGGHGEPVYPPAAAFNSSDRISNHDTHPESVLRERTNTPGNSRTFPKIDLQIQTRTAQIKFYYSNLKPEQNPQHHIIQHEDTTLLLKERNSKIASLKNHSVICETVCIVATL